MTKNTKKEHSSTENISYNTKIDSDNIAQEKSSLLTNILKDVAKQAFKAIKLYTLVLITFGLGNLCFLIMWLIDLQKYFDSILHFCLFILSSAIGIVGFAIAVIFTYKYRLLNTIQIVYKYLESFFGKLCVKIIDLIINKGNKLTGKDIHNAINVNNLLIEVYGQKLPSFLQKSIAFVIKKIPFGEFIIKMHNDFKDKKDKRELSAILYNYLNIYITESIFGSVSMQWIYWLFPLNMIIQIGLLIAR